MNKKEIEIMRIYEKPKLEKLESMDFLEEYWEELFKGEWCFGCTNCNCN